MVWASLERRRLAAARARHLPRAGGRRRIAGDLLYDNYFDCHRAEKEPGALVEISRRAVKITAFTPRTTFSRVHFSVLQGCLVSIN